MLSANKLVLDIGSGYIKLVTGNTIFGKTQVISSKAVKTPENSIVDGDIKDINLLADTIRGLIAVNNIKAEYVSYVIHGQDIVQRHMETPIMDDKSIMASLKWEVGQFLPEGGEKHYIDYQILEKISTKEKKIYKLFVVAVPKAKVDKFVELTNLLGLKLDIIDLSPSCVGRAFSKIERKSIMKKSVAVIDIGNRASYFTVLDKGKLVIEREVPFGTENIIIELSSKLNLDKAAAFDYLVNKFNLENNSDYNEADKKVIELLDSVFSIFMKVVQFYTAGKVKKRLNSIYIIGGGSEINGMEDYVSNIFDAPAQKVNERFFIFSKINFKERLDYNYFLNALGLLLRGGREK